jgi:hypothetical protein
LIPSYLLNSRTTKSKRLVMIMGLINLCMTLLFLSMLASFLGQTRTEAAATHLNTACPNTTTFTANSTYQANLKHLLTYLSSNATINLGFYNASAGNSVDTVYGLFLCHGGVPAETVFPWQPKR